MADSTQDGFLRVDPTSSQSFGPLKVVVDSGSTNTVDTELTTADLDTGAATDTRAVVGLVRAESGGATLVGSANPLPVDTELPAAAALADSTANPTTVSVGVFPHIWDGSNWQRLSSTGGLVDGNSFNARLPVAVARFNGTTWDKERNNIDVSLLASAARTTTQTGADTTNYNGVGILITVDVTSAGTGSITPKIQGKDANGIYFDIWTAAAAITANGTKTYAIHPGSATAGNLTEAIQQFVPRTFRIVITANNANSVTYSAAYSLVVV